MCPRLRRSISASANSVSSSVENAIDDRAGRDRRARRQCAGGGLESVARGQHRVEHPVELPPPDVGAEPARPAAAERDDPGPVTAAQRALHHLNGAAHAPFGRLGRRPRRLRIRVDSTTTSAARSVSRSRDMQAAAARAHRPVDRAQLVAGHVRADVGVLDARPDVPGQVGAEPVEQFGPRDRGGLRRGQREHEHVGGVDGRRCPRAARRGATTSTRARIGYRPQRSAATATVCRRRDRRSTTSSRMPVDTGSRARRSTAAGVSAVGPHAHRASARPRSSAAGPARRARRPSAPSAASRSSTARRAVAPRTRSSCQRDPITAAASATAAQVAIARVNGDGAPTQLDFGADGLSITPVRLGPRNRQPPQQFLHDVGAVHAAHPHLRPQADPVRHGRHGERLDVLGDHVVAAEQQRAGAGELDQVEFGARAGADGDLRMLPGRGGQRHHVAQHVVVHGHLLHRFAHGEQVVRVDDLMHGRLGRAALEAAAQHRRLLLLGQVPQFEPDREPVQLRLGQRIGALVLDRVVGGQHDERVRAAGG